MHQYYIFGFDNQAIVTLRDYLCSYKLQMKNWGIKVHGYMANYFQVEKNIYAKGEKIIKSAVKC